MYLDSAYIAKFYVSEPDSARVRTVLQTAEERVSSVWALAEVACAIHRHAREGHLTKTEASRLSDRFQEHIEAGVWRLEPLTERLIRQLTTKVKSLPAGVCIRSGDALHLTTASALGEAEIWTNDRRLLAAAPYFGLTGRSA